MIVLLLFNMIEFFRHFFGFCGEHWHPNVWNAIAFSPIVLYGIYYLKNKINKIND